MNYISTRAMCSGGTYSDSPRWFRRESLQSIRSFVEFGKHESQYSINIAFPLRGNVASRDQFFGIFFAAYTTMFLSHIRLNIERFGECAKRRGA